MTAVPDTTALKEYSTLSSYTDEQLESALAAEKADQAARCRVDPYNDALAEALCRRVLRNINMRNQPLGQTDNEFGVSRIGSTDPEVRRLEGPYRRLVVG